MNPTRNPAKAASSSPLFRLERPLGGRRPGNDNAVHGGQPDTTAWIARPEVVRAVRATLRRHRVAWQDVGDAIADVQVECLETARARGMPVSLSQWKALATTIAARWALDRLRASKRHAKYDAGPCDDPDPYLCPTLYWEHRDPVDTKRYLAVLKDLFDSGQMPERGVELLVGEAEQVPHREIAEEIGVSTTVVDNRLFRMRARFRARLTALGMLAVLLLLITGVLLMPLAEVAAPAPPATSAQPHPAVSSLVAWDGGLPPSSENRSFSSEEVAP